MIPILPKEYDEPAEAKGLKGLLPESWFCVDCGVNTAPGFLNRIEMEQAIAALGEKWIKGEGVDQSIGWDAEVYTVRDAVWKRPGWRASVREQGKS
jgi:hypothetical protein